MASNIQVFVLLIIIGVFQCNGVSWRRQLEHIAKTRLENEGLSDRTPKRRFYQFDPRELSSIVGVPSRASHLPEAEPLQPGHTLLRPALGMLKSALKFPHRELENGAGVYGNVENLGLKYDSRNERLMYSGFRRFPSDYIMVIPSAPQDKSDKPRYKLESAVLNMDRQAQAKNEILKILKKLNIPALKGVKVFVATENGNYLEKSGKSTAKDSSFYLNEIAPKHTFKNTIEAILRSQVENSAPSSILKSQDTGPEINTQSRHTISEDGNHVQMEEEKKKKIPWIDTMDTFDHIQIMEEAPDLDELVPTMDDGNIRKWWFYNADDYQPFSRERYK